MPDSKPSQPGISTADLLARLIELPQSERRRVLDSINASLAEAEHSVFTRRSTLRRIHVTRGPMRVT